MSKRLASIDALRGIALLLMVVDHSFDWWLAATWRGGFADQFTEFLGTLAAPIFVVLVGVGMTIAVARQQQRGVPNRQIIAQNVRRGLLFMVMAWAMNFIIFFVGDNWADVLALDVLHLIGLGIVIGVFLALYTGPVLALVLSLLWLAGSALLGGDIQLSGWAGVGTWLNAQPGINYFPLIPWLAYVGLGVASGKLAQRLNRERDGLPALNSGWLALVAAGLFVLFIITPNIGYRHPRLGFVAFSLSIMFALWAVLQRLSSLPWWLARWPVMRLALLGQVAFMLYFFHHLIGYRLLYHLGIVTGRSWFGHFGALNPTQAVLGLLILVVLCYAVAGPWLRVRAEVQAKTLGRLPGFRQPPARIQPDRPA